MSDTGVGPKDAQEGAEAVVARIADIVGDHWPSGGGGSCEWCDWRTEKGGTWPEHVAAAVVESLGLTPEWTVQSRWGIEEERVSDVYATPAGIADWRNQQDIPTKVVQRFVTAWEQA